MKKIKLILILTLGAFTFFSCETTDLDLLDNPNALTPGVADLNLYMNGIQVRTANFTHTAGNFGAQVTRLTYMRGRTYDNVYSATTFSTMWNLAYSSILNDIQLMKALADDLEGFEKHSAVGKVLEAHILLTLTDLFGDVPYSQGFSLEFPNPVADPGADVYASALTLLDEAIATFNTGEGQNLVNDFFYGNNFSTWTKLANSLKMKAYIQTRLVDAQAISKFEQIVSSGNFIGAGEDFVFNYGTNIDNPNSRHPLYNGSYGPGGLPSNGIYMSNWLMDLMKNDKPVEDPRMRYYFYRQVADVASNVGEEGNELRCVAEPIPPHYQTCNAVYCIIDNDEGYWGRDHGSEDGIPPDGELRTLYGIYPAGGRFDDNTFEHIDGNNFGAEGAGFVPILLASTVDFWRAEASLFGGSGSTTMHVVNGVQKSINLVTTFTERSASTFDADFIPPAIDIATYTTTVTNRLNAAGSNNERLELIGKEFFITLFGNGNDAFNFYRRTGYPALQPNLEPAPGIFFRSMFYPASEVIANSSISQKPNVGVKVFW
ncbi:MAG: SusD/RagB family nutrient-binding outer membrane lipoprotein, partial [Flavobacteriales bacterium]|nr:SusD/RagB family nutrient-binding outer membrane lipoprotein [Flavobacteriales bacterium]